VRSERQFCERLQYDLLFKWFMGMIIIDPAFDASTFSRSKKRLLEHEVAREFLSTVQKWVVTPGWRIPRYPREV